ncbi:2-hydroxycarboxylate transporter family protein [Caldicellulosiruptor naganoensis]|uniref:2-hydroxycarboxylate transporter family protein n=1 Tax=Caldicellulosiruptor naganoensis TaxID=29324 RepID=A0ABY7BIN4_9FIRM|nr:2-hydroxycarboxylate transporter family protein [Caldicellulosiruptor naganoensis]WAM32197.1 2-hydroxycarboxylate transporter family protein [Caldicellulosiruptor naganoensis]
MTKEGFKIAGFSLSIFLILTIIIFASVYLNLLPSNMVGAFGFMIVIGAILWEIGNRLPIIKDYLGGAPIVIIFGTAALVMFKLLPEGTIKTVNDFMKTSNFLDFYIAALITGSILGMDRRLLINAGARYFPALFGGIIASLGLVSIVGKLIGYGWKEALLYIGIPIMGGGMGAGAVPMSKIYGGVLNQDPTSILSRMVPAVALGNALAIIAAGMLDRIGKMRPQLTGNGRIMPSQDINIETEKKFGLDLTMMGMGMLMSCTFYVLGNIIGNFVPSIHPFAWMIISVAVAKILGLLPEKLEQAASQWYQFVVNYWTAALLVGIGISYTNLADIIAAMSWQYILLVCATVVGAILGTWIIGKWVGFYPIEASITAGLCMANMGGTGDVAVLSACKRMELMPFAQISSRIGGAIMLIIGGFLVSLIGK